MANLQMRRVGAYLLDILVVSLLAMLVGQLNFINPNKDKYLRIYDEYVEYYESNFGNTTTMEAEDLINDEYAGYMYDLQYYAIGNTLAETLVIILYFTLFPLFNNNQTIGKRIFKIKVVHSADDTKTVSIWQHAIRSVLLPIVANIILYNAVTSLLNVVMLFIFNGVDYLYTNLAITYIINTICYADVIAMFARKDHRSLHDIICKTKVVEAC